MRPTEIDNSRAESNRSGSPAHNGIAQEIPRICALLRQECGHDFASYRSSTLTRRLLRRMQMRRVASAAEYRQLLEKDADEARALFNDLLINVTAFFRDAVAFDALAQLVIPEIVRRMPKDEPIRIWVPACAAGQEAYSIAMLVAEEMERVDIKRRVQVFATDIDERCLRIARQGQYPASVVQEVSARRLQRFFQRVGKRWVVAPELREMCIFSAHNVITDPPFSRIELVSCRNLLIYLGVNLQKKLMSVFHYALRPGGYLFLGPSETITEHAEFFRTVDAKSRISQKKRGGGQPQSMAAMLPEVQRMAPTQSNDPQSPDLAAIVRPIVLTEFAPPHAVVDAGFQCTYLSAQMGRFLSPSEGPFQNNLLKMVPPALRVALRAALNEARRTGHLAVRGRISRRSDQSISPVRLMVRPLELGGDSAGAFLVVFQEEGQAYALDEGAEEGKDQGHALIDQLERELSSTRDDLNTSIQELEVANEELKSSNEELLSMNEELHSTNEELETSKEEVQRAFNALATAKDDLENLLSSTQIATIFLDERHRIQSFTPAVAGIYSLLGVDIGRKLSDITHSIVAMPALPSLSEALESDGPIEHEVQAADGRSFLRRILPYRTREGEATGLVVAFLDVTELRESEEKHRKIIQGALDCVITIDSAGRVVDFNPSAEATFGLTLEAAVGKPLAEIILPERFRAAHTEGIRRFLETGEAPLLNRRIEMPALRADGREFPAELTVGLIPGHRRPGAALFTAFLRDISQRKADEENIKRHVRTLATVNRVNISLAGELDLEKLVQAVTDAGTELTGAQFGAFFYNAVDERGEKYTLYTISGVPREKFEQFPMPRNTDLFGPTFRGEGIVRLGDVTQDPRYGKNEPHFGMPRGHLPVRSYLAVPVTSRNGEVLGGLFFGHEQAGRFTEEHEQLISGIGAQAAIAIDNARLYGESSRLAAIVESTSDIVIGKDLSGTITSWNRAAAETYGYTEEEALGQQISFIVPEDKREELEKLTAALLRGEAISGFETQRVAKDGRRLDVLLTLSPTYSTDGRLIGSSVIARDITERKRAEAALARASGRLNAIINTAVDGIVTIDERGLVESANPAAERMFGYSAEEMVGKNVKMLMPEPYLGEHDGYLRNYLSTGQKKIIGIGREVVGRRKDGSTFPMDLAVSETKLGERSIFTGLVRDVTDRKRAEADRAALAAIVSSSEDAIVSKDLHGIVQTWNAGAERLFGYSAEEMIGKPIRKLIPPERQSEEDEILAKLSRGERIEHYETVRVSKDGRHVHVALAVSPIRNAAGEVIGASKIARNITGQKQAHEQIRVSEARYRKIFQSAYVSIWQEDFTKVKDFIAELQAQGITDLRAHFEKHPDELDKAMGLVRIVDVNEATLAMFEAVDASELMESLERVFLPEAKASFIDVLVAVAEQRAVVSSEARLRTLRGRPIDVVFSVSLPAAPADWSAVLVSMMDVTERREAEQALRESQERLRIAISNAPLVLYHCDRELRFTWFADEPHPDFPMSTLIGRTFKDVLGAKGEPLMQAMERVLQSGRGERIEFSLDTSLGRQTWDNTLEPLRDFTGATIGITGCALEVTERKQAEERQQLLLAELSHRVKNTLATVQSVATQTAIHATSVPEFRKSFESRLHSLAQTHSLLTRSRWKGAELRAIVIGEMGAHGGLETGRVRLTGPTIYLTPRAALSLHLVLHELATNAAKYGALTCETGCVAITWSILDEPGGQSLRLSWTESGGPRVIAPGHRGFGTTIIENSVGYELDGQTNMQYLEEGLRCEFRIPWGDEIGFAAQSL